MRVGLKGFVNMPVISIRVPPTLHEKLLDYCERKDTKPSAVVLDFLGRMIDHLDDMAYNPMNPPPGGTALASQQIVRRLPTSGIVGFHPVTGEVLEAKPAYGSRLKQPKKAKE